MDKYLMFASTMKEKVLESAKKRLQLEMGIDCNLEWVYSFIYKEKVENNLIDTGLITFLKDILMKNQNQTYMKSKIING
ncbi:MAG TPA: hypothetical protein PK041_10750 [Kaistella sp.]|nr:hypothetical protein [Kaistella sp.]